MVTFDRSRARPLRPTTRLVIVDLALVTFLVLAAVPASAQRLPGNVVGNVQVDVGKDPGSPRAFATGFVTNHGVYRITNVRLRVEAQDATGQPLAPTFGWVWGDIAAGGRAAFKVALPANAGACTITVESFDLVTYEGP